MLPTAILPLLLFQPISEAIVIKRTEHLFGTQGFTLVELIVTMAVFMTVLIISANAFNTIVTNASKYSKSEESNIEGMIGLEVMRHDLEQMGFGLPWGFGGSIDYEESTESNNIMNDEPSGVPRPFVGYDNHSSAVIGVKASTVGSSKASQRWTYIPFQNYSASTRESRPINLGANIPRSNDKVIALLTSFNNYTTASLRMSGSTYGFDYENTEPASNFRPQGDQDTIFVYGLSPSGSTLRMPFNRADFFMKKTDSVPSFCAPNTGVLYKATVNHDGGGYTHIPLLDCVASMQVVLGWSSNAGTENVQDSISTYSSLPLIDTGDVTTVAAGTEAPIDSLDIKTWLNDKDAKKIREQLKLVKVYVLAQEGKRDSGYTYPAASILIGSVGEESLTRTYVLSEEQRHYRWKLYRIIVKPKNLISNQR